MPALRAPAMARNAFISRIMRRRWQSLYDFPFFVA
jgi:hypothetical protein